MTPDVERKIAVARRAVALMERGECRYVGARDAKGRRVSHNSRNADRFCSLGALWRAELEVAPRAFTARRELADWLESRVIEQLGDSLININDRVNDGPKLIIAALRDIARELEAEATR